MTTATGERAGQPRLLTRVKSTLFVHTRRRSRSLLEGEYASVHHGRSLDYVDLRAYVPGDEMRDIDWKATARHGSPLVRRYVASRKQNLMIVADTGRGMAATSASGESKRDIAVLVAGLVGYLAQRHGDLVGLVRGTSSATVAHPLRGSEAHLELLLRAMHTATALDGDQSNLTAQLRWIVRHVKRRLILLVVADDRELDPSLDDLLRRLHVQHEILWCTVEDADPTAVGADRTTYDVADTYTLPTVVRLAPKVRRAYAEAVAARRRRTQELLDRRGVIHIRVGSSGDVVEAVHELLERQRSHAR